MHIFHLFKILENYVSIKRAERIKVNLKIILALGNPDPQYKNTRHNVGFLFLEWLAKTQRMSQFKKDPGLNAEILSANLGKTKVLLIKPLTFVNNSGEVVRKIKNKIAKIKTDDFIVVHDDLDTPFGTVKIKFNSGTAGHRGLESVARALKTQKFYRLKIGTANRSMEKMRSAPKRQKTIFVTKFVLSQFTPGEKKQLKNIFKAAKERLQQTISR